MKRLKQGIALLLALTLTLTACGGGESTESTETGGETSTQESTADGGEDTGTEGYGDDSLYLITDLGTIDDKSFNQGSFEGLQAYGEEIGVEAQYLRPAGEGDQIYVQTIEQAVNAGAKLVVTPGFLFENALGSVQDEHPDVNFIAVDFVPRKDGEAYVADNTTSILYREEQSGFLAGYAAVKDGYTELGFMGGVAVPAVIRYGFGYIAGANYAAEEMGVDVNIKFNYTGSFEAKPEIQTMASSWYSSGTEVIFSCGGGIASSVLKAAQDNGGKMIGVDVDQKDMGEEVITSAMKNLQGSVYDAAAASVRGEFPGGEVLTLGVEENGVQLSDDFSRFNVFTEEDYNEIYEKLVANTDGITDSIPVIDETLPQEEQGNPENIMDGMNNVTLDYITQ